MFFTVYWLDGHLSLLRGDTIEDAFRKAGYGGGAVNAVDWFDPSPIPTHTYDKATRQWIKREDLTFVDREILVDRQGLVDMFSTKTNRLTLEFPDKNQLVLKRDYGHYPSGEIAHLSVTFGEYYDGPYHPDGEEPHHYMATHSMIFAPEDVVAAVDHFVYRALAFMNGVPKDWFRESVPGATTLQELADRL